MNERIEKLAEQTGMVVDKYGLARDAKNGLEDGVDIYKFAELIVRECIDQLYKDDTISVGAQVVLTEKIKQHFGVE